jgi:hypothetical protein
MMLWPRFKVVFDAHLASVRTASERALLTDDLQGHYIARRYAEFAASAHSLTAVNGDAQLDQNMVRCVARVRVHAALLLTRRLRHERRSDCAPRCATCLCASPSSSGSARGSWCSSSTTLR